MAIIPRRVEGSFDEALFDFLAESEGFVPRVYSGRFGMPMLALGYAMLDNTPGWPPRDSLDRDLAAIGVRLTSLDRCRLTAVGEALSCHDLDAARRLVAPWTPGEDPQTRNAFSFVLTRGQAQALFELSRPDTETLLRRKLGRALSAVLAGSRELVALFSLAYNSPALIGPNLSRALHAGAREKVWYEIRFRSNRRRCPRLQDRRDHEAAMFGVTNAHPSPSDSRAVATLLTEKHTLIKRYLQEVGQSMPDVRLSVAAMWQGIGLPPPPCAVQAAAPKSIGNPWQQDDPQPGFDCVPHPVPGKPALLDR
ncbi:MAG: hypothetical protein ACFB13_19890 [Kiloniellaceae bacterium]